MNDGIFFNQSKYIGEMLKKFGMENSKVTKTPMSKKRVLTLDKYSESIGSTKYRGMIESEIWDKIKEPLSPRLNEDEYSICYEKTIHMMNDLKEARMKFREMLLSIYHSLKMLLDIISNMNRKLEDEKIKRNDKGKEKVNDF
ncbi:hypothetical protein Tco_1503101 [Tanacetum coccineum]